MTKPTDSELTFCEQQQLTEILELYRSNPSNSNKYPYQLFAEIDVMFAQRDQQRLSAVLEAVELLRDVMEDQVGHHDGRLKFVSIEETIDRAKQALTATLGPDNSSLKDFQVETKE